MNTLSMLPIPLLQWYREHARDLPWRRTPDPYRVWVSEIMLQQTRVAAVLGYFARFMAAFPTIQDLADAPEDVLMKQWQGLGYYSRARNLQKAARQIMDEHGGVFPHGLPSHPRPGGHRRLYRRRHRLHLLRPARPRRGRKLIARCRPRPGR